MIDTVVIESLGLGLVGSGSYLVTKYFQLIPFDSNVSPAANKLYFILIPTLSYILFRIIFGISIWISGKMRSVAPRYFVPEVAKYSIITFAFYIIYHQLSKNPLYQETINDFQSTYLGDLPVALYEQSLPSILTAYELGKKVLGLVFGWFVMLFAVERLVWLLLWIIRSCVSSVMTKKKVKEA